MFYSQFIVPIFYAEYSIASSEPNSQEHSILRTSFISGNLFTEIYISSYSRTSVELLFWAFLWLACWVIFIVPGYYVVSFVCSLFFFFALLFLLHVATVLFYKNCKGKFSESFKWKKCLFSFPCLITNILNNHKSHSFVPLKMFLHCFHPSSIKI